MEGQTKRSKCVCHPSNGHEGSSRPARASTLDSHGQGWPCGEWACKQATRDPYVPRLPPPPPLPAPVFYLYFIFLLHADEMSLNFVRLAYVGGRREGHENSSISYWKVSCGRRIRDFVIYIHRRYFSLFPFPFIFVFRFRVYSAEYKDTRDSFSFFFNF